MLASPHQTSGSSEGSAYAPGGAPTELAVALFARAAAAVSIPPKVPTPSRRGSRVRIRLPPACYMGFRFWLIRSLLRSEAASD